MFAFFYFFFDVDGFDRLFFFFVSPFPFLFRVRLSASVFEPRSDFLSVSWLATALPSWIDVARVLSLLFFFQILFDCHPRASHRVAMPTGEHSGQPELLFEFLGSSFSTWSIEEP